jgi:hypothetical protein
MKFLPTNLSHLWQLLRDGRVGGDVIEVAPDPSTNILRNVTDPVEDQDAATKKWVEDNFGKINYNEVHANVTLPNIATVDQGELYLYKKTADNYTGYRLVGDAAIDGDASGVTLYNLHETYILKSNGSAWVVVSHFRSENEFLSSSNLNLNKYHPENIHMTATNLTVTIGAANTYITGKVFTIYNDVVWSDLSGEAQYLTLTFNGSDLKTVETNTWEVGPQMWVKIMTDGTNWFVVGRSKKKLQRTVTASTYSVKSYDDIILADATSNDITISLIEIGSTELIENLSQYVKRIDTVEANSVTIDVSGGGNIDEDTAMGLGHANPIGDSMEFYSTKDKYHVI